MKLNNQGSALIFSFFVMSVLVTLSTAFAILTFGELNDARRYRDLTSAFWLAESGINLYMQNPSILNKVTLQSFHYKSGAFTDSKDDSRPGKRVITSTGFFGGSRRSIQIEYPANAPDVFNNVVSVDGNIMISGGKSAMAFNDKTRISGRVVNSSKHSQVYFEDRQDGVAGDLVSLTYPDTNENGTEDEFDDFVQYNRKLLATYPKSEVVYIQGDDTFTFLPNKGLNGKRIVYIEGQEGKGNVTINFTGNWEDEDQNLTIISTGNVTFNQISPQMQESNSQLNIIAWSGYRETAALPGSHKGMTFTHGKAEFDEVDEASVTYGSVVANDGISIKEVWSKKSFNYADTRTKGVVPPGFEGLLGRGAYGFSARPSAWREI